MNKSKINYILLVIIVGLSIFWVNSNIDIDRLWCNLWVIDKTEYCENTEIINTKEDLNTSESIKIDKEDEINKDVVETDEGIYINIDEVEEIDFTEEQLQLYYSVYEDPFVIHLRKALNGYLDGTNEGMEIPEAAIEDRNIGVQSGLSSFDKSYYEGKFVVIFIDNNAPMGGSVISIIFQDKPDKIFDAWVYDMLEDEYDLRGFWLKDMSDNEIDVIMKQYGKLIKDKEHSL